MADCPHLRQPTEKALVRLKDPLTWSCGRSMYNLFPPPPPLALNNVLVTRLVQFDGWNLDLHDMFTCRMQQASAFAK